MKKTNKGFTLVELIIVIAVIGVLAAILIPVFANVIEKANRSSAYSDAKNALEIFISEKSSGDGAEVVTNGSVFMALKAKKYWQFNYENNGLVDPKLDPVAALPAAFVTGSHTLASTYTTANCANLPATVTIFMAVAE